MKKTYLGIFMCAFLSACESGIQSGREQAFDLEVTSEPEDHQRAWQWPLSARIELSELGERQLRLSWPSPVWLQPDEQTQEARSTFVYRLFNQQGVLLHETNESSYLLNDLNPKRLYQLFLDARDTEGHLSQRALTVTFETLDLTPPSWREARFEGVHLARSPHSTAESRPLRFSWLPAFDEGGVQSYEIWKDEQKLVRLPAHELTWQFTESNAQQNSYSLFAIDSSGLRSEALTVTVDIDQESRSLTRPTWPAQAQLRIAELEERSFTLHWPSALGSPSAYRIYQEGQLVAQVDEITQLNYHFTELRPLSALRCTVTAINELGLESEALTTFVQLTDQSQPTWPNRAQLKLNQREEAALTLEWSAAQDLSGIAKYTIFVNGNQYTSVSGTFLWTKLEDLQAWTEYEIELYAEGFDGRVSASPLSLTAKTADTTPPVWPQHDSLQLQALSPSELRLSWPSASDSVGLASYQILLNGERQQEITEALTTETEVETVINQLQAWADYQVSVIAIDLAGNESTSLNAQIRMPDPNPPTWPQGAEIRVETLNSTHGLFSWPAAQDLGGVERYELRIDGEVRMVFELNHEHSHLTRLSTELFELLPGRLSLLEIFAYDRAGSASLPLLLSFSPPDGTAPEWPLHAELQAIPGVTEVRLLWPQALDDVGVVAYELYRNDQFVRAFQANEAREFLLEGLLPESEYRLGLQALDASGKHSNLLEVQVITGKAFDPGFRRLSREQLLRTLADLHAEMWQSGCLHPVHGENGCSIKRTSDDFYLMFTETNWGRWLDFRRAYPNDDTVSPEGELRGGYQRFDQLVYPEHIHSWVSAVKYIANDYDQWIGADTLVRRPCEWEQQQGLTQFANQNEMLRACHASWVARFAPLAMRRAITEEEQQDFISIYDEVQSEYADLALNPNQLFHKVIATSLFIINLQPEYLYHVEVGDEQGELTAYELANRLAYHFWDTMPDQALFEAAADGSLLTESGFEAQVERLFQDPKSIRSVEAFYRDFFRVKALPDINALDGPGGWSNFNYLTGPNQEEGEIPHYNNTGGSNGNIVEAMSREMINLGSWFTFHQPDSYREMFSSNLHFLECSPYIWEGERCTGAGPWSIFTYKVNGVCSDMSDCNQRAWLDTETGWDGTSPPITLPEPQRAGLVTRMPMLVHDTLSARPIRRGLNIREMLLCDPVPPPENCDVVKPPSVEGRCVSNLGVEGQVCKWDADCQANELCEGADSPVSMTVREKVEALTEVPGTSCAGCHSTYINGFGHALNHFSTTGQYWEEEHMFTNQRNGNGDFWWFTHQANQWREIDDTGTTLYNDQWVTMNGAHELRDFLLDTGRLEWCWSREYFRYTMGRVEWEEEADTIENIAESLRQGTSLADAFKSVVYSDSFHRLYKAPNADAPFNPAPTP